MKKLFSLVFKNWAFKIIALLLAGLIWYLVQAEEILEIATRVEVQFELPENYAMKESLPLYRDVNLRGPRVLLVEYEKKSVPVSFKIPAGKTGTLKLRLDRELFTKLDHRIKVFLNDPFITVHVDEKLVRGVPARPQFSGSPKIGLELGQLVIEPPEITISGLKKDVQQVKHVMTEPIDIANLEDHKQIVAPISMTNLADFDVAQTQVKVSIPVVEKKITKKIEGIPVSLLNSEFVGSVKPATVVVTLTGLATEIQNLKRDDINAYVDVGGIKPDSFEKEVQVKLPRENVEIEVNPKKVSIEIYNQKKITK